MKKTSRFGRGTGSFRMSEGEKGTERSIRGSFHHAKRGVDFDPKEFITAESSEREIDMFKQVFDYLDNDHDGMLTPLDLRKAMREYGGYKPGRPFVYVVMSKFDADDGGQITFREFVKMMTVKPCQEDTEEDIQNVFDSMDENKNGFISPEDLMSIAEQLKEDISPAQIREMIKNCDPDGNGVISREAFIKFNKKKKFD